MNLLNEIKDALMLDEEYLYEMANIKRNRTGLSADIWVDSEGSERKNKHNEPRVKLHKDYNIKISIEKTPRILALPEGVKESKAKRDFRDAIDFVGEYCEIFRRHYFNTIDDVELFDELREKKAMR